jgi:SNF2 family DNA or RNA helicase
MDIDITLPGEGEPIKKKKPIQGEFNFEPEPSMFSTEGLESQLLPEKVFCKDVNYLSLGGDMSPMEHQKDCFYKLHDKKYAGIFGEQGTGKTRMAIDIVSNHYVDKKINAVLLIAPKGVHEQWWNKEIPKHSPVDTERFLWEAKSTKGYLSNRTKFINLETKDLKWMCVNVDLVSTDNNIFIIRDFIKKHKCAVIVDESTRIKNPTANRTFNIMYNLAGQIKRGRAIKEIVPYSKYRYVLTGMQVTNSPYDVWAPFTFLDFKFFDMNFYAFKAKYGIEVQDTNRQSGRRFSRRITNVEKQRIIALYKDENYTFEQIGNILGIGRANVEYICTHPQLRFPYKHLDELKDKIMPYTFTVTKEECLDLLPKVYQTVICEMSAEQKRVYKELQKKLITEYEGKELSVANKVALTTRLQQITSGFFPHDDKIYNEEEDVWELKKEAIPIGKKNPKIEALKAQLEENGEHRIFIACRFVAEIKLVVAELSKSYPDKVVKAYYGAVPDKERAEIKNGFEQGHIDILVINVRMAIGFNFQEVCHNGYAFSGTYSLEDRKQWEDRIHRIGQTLSVNYLDFIMKGTIDEKIHQAIEQKEDLLNYFRDHTVSEFLS